jgi:hypothetical protein
MAVTWKRLAFGEGVVDSIAVWTDTTTLTALANEEGFLHNDGEGVITWEAPGGGGSPGGSDGQIQFNNDGAFGGAQIVYSEDALDVELTLFPPETEDTAGGSFSITGRPANGEADGGDVILQGGDSPGGSSHGGNVILQSGQGDSDGKVLIAHGYLSVPPATSLTIKVPDAEEGDVPPMELRAGSGLVTGQPGAVSLYGGNTYGAENTNKAGAVQVIAGSANGQGDGGDVLVTGGQSVEAQGGNIILTPGTGATPGAIQLPNQDTGVLHVEDGILTSVYPGVGVLTNDGSDNLTWEAPGGSGAVPVGGIIMWSGTVATIPTNWHLCDGDASTPDLRDKFVIGATSDDAGVAKTNVTGSLTQSGGAVTHHHADHSVTQPQAHTFTQPSAHSNHTFTQPAAHSNHTFTQPSAHTTTSNIRGSSSGTVVTGASHSGGAVDAHSAHSGGAVDAHSAHSGGAVDAHAGAAVSTHDTLSAPQPYYALAFIMRTA